MKILKFSLLFTLFCGAAFVTNIDSINASTHEEKQLKEFVKGNNYIPAVDAILQFEQLYGEKVHLPRKLPFTPSHHFGQIDEEGRLKLHYMRISKIDEYPTQDFSFYIMQEVEIERFIDENDQVLKLENGEKAYYRQYDNYFHTLAFRSNNLGYHFGGNPHKVDLATFLEVANTIK